MRENLTYMNDVRKRERERESTKDTQIDGGVLCIYICIYPHVPDFIH